MHHPDKLSYRLYSLACILGLFFIASIACKSQAPTSREDLSFPTPVEYFHPPLTAEQVIFPSPNGDIYLKVVQQPKDKPKFVSPDEYVLTQYAACRGPCVAVMAHNPGKAGEFIDLAPLGTIIKVDLDSGQRLQYIIDHINLYHRIDYDILPSIFTPLDSQGVPIGSDLSEAEVFRQNYAPTAQSTFSFQACKPVNGKGKGIVIVHGSLIP